MHPQREEICYLAWDFEGYIWLMYHHRIVSELSIFV